MQPGDLPVRNAIFRFQIVEPWRFNLFNRIDHHPVSFQNGPVIEILKDIFGISGRFIQGRDHQGDTVREDEGFIVGRSSAAPTGHSVVTASDATSLQFYKIS
jgi:hypothetical protein